MKAIIIYNTATGNTKALALKMREIFEKYKHTCEIYRDQDIQRDVKNNPQFFDPFDILLLGSCTHGFQPAISFNSFISSIKNYELKNKSLISFSSSGIPGIWKTTCQRIRENFPKMNHLGDFGCALRNFERSLIDFEELVKKL